MCFSRLVCMSLIGSLRISSFYLLFSLDQLQLSSLMTAADHTRAAIGRHTCTGAKHTHQVAQFKTQSCLGRHVTIGG